ncbi:MAG TPA: DNA-binding domain-containing protein [Moraxellaceae bacterium]|nr:DNA-binding domain-containing protein [Moraxellaceae bacterium]
MASFHDYVRGRTDDVPSGYTEAGMRLYRHLVYLGASQMLEAHFPEVQAALGEEGWRQLLQAFIRESKWDSPFYGDMKDEFLSFLARQME